MGVQGGGADADGVMAGGGGFGIQDDHRELTPFPDAGDLLNASFFLEPEVLPVHSSALDSVVGVYAVGAGRSTPCAFAEATDVETADPACGARFGTPSFVCLNCSQPSIFESASQKPTLANRRFESSCRQDNQQQP